MAFKATFDFEPAKEPSRAAVDKKRPQLIRKAERALSAALGGKVKVSGFVNKVPRAPKRKR